MIGIIVADENELKDIDFQTLDTKKIGQFNFIISKIGKHDVIAVHSGIGLVNAAAATQSLIENFDIEKIMNFGAVGAIGEHKVYDVIKPEKILFHDVHTPWYEHGQTPGEEPYYRNAFDVCDKVNIGSGSSFVADLSVAKELNQKIDIELFDMEIAAVAQIAYKNNVPLYIVKCVSDNISNDVENLEGINERIKKAGQLAFEETKQIIELT